MTLFLRKAFCLAAVAITLITAAGAQAQTRSQFRAFTNPIAVGADPWVVFHNGHYYWCLSQSAKGVAIAKSDTLTSVGKRQTVWKALKSGPHSHGIWAPELHLLDGRWYIYVAADDGKNANHRMIVLESETGDPLSKYTFKGELYTGDNIAKKIKNRWAIDGTVLTHKDRRYFVWSGWSSKSDEQYLYIAPMSNPWTVSGNRVRLCKNDTYLWEFVSESRNKNGLNEAPQILQHGDRTFLIYSASGSWQRFYKLGLLELTGADPLNPSSWRKHPKPVFAPTNQVFGVGHSSFTTSPDGTEFWHVYHAKRDPADGHGDRSINIQPFTWTADGFPDFGTPVPPGTPIKAPSNNK